MSMSDSDTKDTEDGDDMPSLSFKSTMEHDDSIFCSDSDDDSIVSDDDSIVSSGSGSSETKHNNQKVSSGIAELCDLQDLFYLQDSINQLPCDRWEFKRLNWEAHVAQLEHEGLFENEYLMSLPAHRKLVRILDPILQRTEYNSRGEDPILVEHIMAVGLRVLSGGRTKDQRHIIGSSRSAAYKAVDDFVEAVNLSPELAIAMPATPEEWDEIYNQFKSKSTNEIMSGCVGAIDGFFQPTTKPTSKEVANVLAYYSGHYESYGLNCQACVKADLQFMYFGVISPGSTNDNISYPMAKELKAAFDSLPLGRFGVADAAYTLSEGI